MAGANWTVSVWTILVLISASSTVAANCSPECEQECREIKRGYDRFKVKALKAWKEISTGDQLCAPSTRLENQLKKEKAARARQKKDLVTSN